MGSASVVGTLLSCEAVDEEPDNDGQVLALIVCRQNDRVFVFSRHSLRNGNEASQSQEGKYLRGSGKPSVGL